MRQFTVYRNKNPRTKGALPFLVDVQTDLLEDMQTRAVIPLGKGAALARKPIEHLMPAISFEGEDYLLLTPQLAGISRSDLGAVAGSVAEQRQMILSAIDFLLTGF
ncbi:MAG TPA: CcdB family protein [Steroidobacteraceae bacterium]